MTRLRPSRAHRYYPVFLDLAGRTCLVAGGGAVALRKVEGLLACDAAVRLVSPRARPELAALARERRIAWWQQPYTAGALADCFLAIAATDDRAVNDAVVADARRLGVLAVAADDGEGDAILPAVVRRGDVVVAISTGGRSPALARALRQRLARLVDPSYGDLAAIVGDLRDELLAAGQHVPAERWRRALAAPLLRQVRRGDLTGARAALRAALVDTSVRGNLGVD